MRSILQTIGPDTTNTEHLTGSADQNIDIFETSDATLFSSFSAAIQPFLM